MKKKILSVILLMIVIFVVGCDIEESSLKDLTMPHKGIYKCSSILFNGKEKIEEYDKITLELKEESIVYKIKVKGASSEQIGEEKYTLNGDKIKVTGKLKAIFRTFSYEEGVITIFGNFLGMSIIAKFERA